MIQVLYQDIQTDVFIQDCLCQQRQTDMADMKVEVETQMESRQTCRQTVGICLSDGIIYHRTKCFKPPQLKRKLYICRKFVKGELNPDCGLCHHNEERSEL